MRMIPQTVGGAKKFRQVQARPQEIGGPISLLTASRDGMRSSRTCRCSQPDSSGTYFPSTVRRVNSVASFPKYCPAGEKLGRLGRPLSSGTALPGARTGAAAGKANNNMGLREIAALTALARVVARVLKEAQRVGESAPTFSIRWPGGIDANPRGGRRPGGVGWARVGPAAAPDPVARWLRLPAVVCYALPTSPSQLPPPLLGFASFALTGCLRVLISARLVTCCPHLKSFETPGFPGRV